MIARPDECNLDQLVLMLDDQLDVDEQRSVTAHLDSCQACRDELERIAAEGGDWWSDTREILCDLTETERHEIEAHSQFYSSSRTPSDASVHQTGCREPLEADLDQSVRDSQDHWVIGLLDDSLNSHSGALGSIDGMPIHRVVGQGGMGVVLMARDEHLHRFLAIKLLSPMLASTGAARQRFLREAQAAAAVVHPNIVPIYAVSAERKLPYLVMPYVAGGNLQQLLDESGPLPIERVLSIGLQVAEGLVAAHHQGIIHRDIKPANLMLDEGGFRVLITDFGLARALDDSTLTGSGLLAGTPQFMSPEQASGRNLDHRSDIYSLGAVLYSLATGRPPIRGLSTLETLRHIMEESPKPIVEINESYPIWFQKLVDRFMAKDVERRLQSAEEAVALIRSCLAHARAPYQAPLPAALHTNAKTQPLATLILGGSLLCLVLIAVVSLPWSQWWAGAKSEVANREDSVHKLEGLGPSDGATASTSKVDDVFANDAPPKTGSPKSLFTPNIESAEEVDARMDAVDRELFLLRSELEATDVNLPTRKQETSGISDAVPQAGTIP